VSTRSGAQARSTRTRIAAVAALALVVCAVAARPCFAFSVLAHQAIVDRSWEGAIVPALRERFPDASAEDIQRARAFAYGGSHVPDLGYFPFGSRLFTDLVHYVRSGHFVSALLRDANDVDEYAFALGVASHYVADTVGHPEATNRVVPELYPDLREEHGDTVTYADDHSSHIQTEFRFDVFQLSQSRQAPDLYRHAIAFEVSEPVLDRAFRETYGLGLDDVFASTKVAIATYRWGFRELLHEATGIAWELYESDIHRVDPTATSEQFVSDMSRADFEKEFGKTYREPGYFAKFFALLVKVVPDVGPFERLPYKALPADARGRFSAALDHAVAEYQSIVQRSRHSEVALDDRNLDTGRSTRHGEYPPADEAYAELVEKLDDHDFAQASAEVRGDVVRFYREGEPAQATAAAEGERGEPEEVARALARLTGPDAAD